MLLDFCHSTAPHKRLRLPEWYVSNLMMDRALDAVVRRVNKLDLATRTEQAAIRAAGITWRDYDRFMQKYVKTIGDERLTKVPKDLDLKPYRDEHDDDLLRRMLASVKAGKAPKGLHVRDLAEAIQQLQHRVRRRGTLGARRAAAVSRTAK